MNKIRGTAVGGDKGAIVTMRAGRAGKGGLHHHPQHIDIYRFLIQIRLNAGILFAHGGEQQVLGAQKFAAHSAGFSGGKVYHRFRPPRGRHVAVD